MPDFCIFKAERRVYMIANIIDNLTYIISAIIFGHMYIGFKVERQKSKHILVVVVSIISFILAFYFDYDIRKYPLFFITLTIIVYTFFTINLKAALIYSFAFVNMHAFIYIGASIFLESADYVLGLGVGKWIPAICSVSICGILLIFGFLARKYTLLGTGKINRGRIFIIIFIIAVDIFILTAIGTNILESNDSTFMLKTSILYILVTVEILMQLVAVVYLATARDTFREREELTQIYLKEQQQHYEDLSKKEYETKKFRHDILNHLNLMAQMCDDGNIDEVKNYLSQINVHMEKVGSKIATHNDIADAIFNRYYQMCEGSGILLDVKGHFPMKCNISAFDICTILSNLLDNAIRAEKEMDEKIVSVEIRYSDDGIIYITVENDYLEKPKQQSGIFLTTKKNKNEHGFGLENVKDCVNRNNGNTNITTENNKFKVWISLDNGQFEDSSC